MKVWKRPRGTVGYKAIFNANFFAKSGGIVLLNSTSVIQHNLRSQGKLKRFFSYVNCY